jgi:hypothetical protein
MNTPAENSWNELMSSDRIHFKTIETREIDYDFEITTEIMVQFNKWKLRVLEDTDENPTELDMLNYFQNLDVSSSSTHANPKVDVTELTIIDMDDYVNHLLSH